MLTYVIPEYFFHNLDRIQCAILNKNNRLNIVEPEDLSHVPR